MSAESAIPERLRMLAQRTDTARLPTGNGHVSPAVSSKNGSTPTPRYMAEHRLPPDHVSTNPVLSNVSEAWIRAGEPNLGFTGNGVDEAMRGVFSERFAPMSQSQEDTRIVTEPAYPDPYQASGGPPPPQLARHGQFGRFERSGQSDNMGNHGASGEPGLHVPAYATLPRAAVGRDHEKSTSDSSAWLVRGSQLAASIVAGAAIMFALYKWVERNILTPKQQKESFVSAMTNNGGSTGLDSESASESDDIESQLGMSTRVGVASDSENDRTATQDDNTSAPGAPVNPDKTQRQERSRRRGVRKHGRASQPQTAVDSNFRVFDGTESAGAGESAEKVNTPG